MAPNMGPSAPRGLEAAFSSFAAPSTGNRNKSKTSQIRVVARIRPMSEDETKNGYTSVIHPIISQNDASGRSPSRRIFGMSPKRPQRDPSPSRLGPLSFLTPDRKKKRTNSAPQTATKDPTPNIGNGKTPTGRKCLNKEYGTAQSLSAQQKRFDFDAVFASEATQREVYDRSVGDAVRRNIFRGYNTTILAYGMTASGKTYTMSGRRGAEMAALAELSPSARDSHRKSMIADSAVADTSSSSKDENIVVIEEDDGIIPRAVHDLFKAKQRHESAGEVTIHLTFLEIYNDELRDLMVDTGETATSLKLRDQGDDGVVVSGLSTVKVTSAAQVKKLMEDAASRRITSSTQLNMRSSRSHAICTLQVTINPAVNSKASVKSTRAEVISAKLTLVDLAGSERIKETGVVGVQQQESININKDLFVLAKVISALAEKGKKNKSAKVHVPYRDSKLTRLLRDSLGGNCCTVMVACVSPADCALEESVNTLRYADRTKSICNAIKQNVEKAVMTPAECAAMRGENKMLKAKIVELKRHMQKLETGNEDEHSLSRASTRSFEELSLTESVDSMRHRNSMLGYLDVEISKKKSLVADLQKEANVLKSSIHSSSEHLAGVPNPSSEASLSQVASLSEQVSSFKQSLKRIEKDAKKRKEHLRNEIAQLKTELQHLQNERSCLEMNTVQSAASLPTAMGFLRRSQSAEMERRIEMVPMNGRAEWTEENGREDEIQQQKEDLKGATTEIEELRSELSAKDLKLAEHVTLKTQLRTEESLRTECEKNIEQLKNDLLDTQQDRDDLRIILAVHEDSIEKLRHDLGAAKQLLRDFEMENQELQRKVNEKENHDKPTSKANQNEIVETKGILVTHNGQTESSEDVVALEGLQPEGPVSAKVGAEINESFDDSTIATEGELSDVSEHQAIRIHAAKMLFWANKAISKGRGPRSVCSSIASSNGSEFLPTMKRMPALNEQTNQTPGKPPRANGKEESMRPPRARSHPMVISNMDQVKDLGGACNCQNSLFSGNPEHVEFYLPKLGMACACGKQKSEPSLGKEGEDPLALGNILRPWQVDFLKSLEIQSADALVKVHGEKGDALAKEMRKWRKQKKLASVKTKSCGVALHIWTRTCKSVVQSVRKQQAEGVKVVQKPAFLEIAIPSDNRTVSTLGFGSMIGGGTHAEL